MQTSLKAMRVRPGGNHHQAAASVVGGGPQASGSRCRCLSRVRQHSAEGLNALSQAQQRRLSVCVRASGGNNDNDGESGSSAAGIPAALFLFVGSAAYTLTNMREELTDVLYNDDDTISEALAALGFAGFGLGDVAGALLWAAALWYVSPLQLLLVFLGKFDTDRPSDWLMNKLGRATQQPVDAIDYQVPIWIKAAAAAVCLAGGVATAGVLEAGLGDPTWSVSSGIGALFAAAIFEVGRPKRLSVAEAQTLESQWQDFAGFAEARLQRSGRCHESEVFTAFRQRFGKYRSADVLPDSTLRDMLRNWHPRVERTRTGYLRNISLRSASSSSSSSSSSVRSMAAAGSAGGEQQQQQQQQQQQEEGSAEAAAGMAGDTAAAAAEPSLLDAIAAEEAQRKQQQAAGKR